MASNVTLTVLCLNGRRQKISISSNSSYLQVLEDVCKKQNLNPDDYDLKHYKNRVDLSALIRYSGYPNNALFELVPVETRRIEKDIMVGLQLESGERLMNDFKPATNLWDIICYWQKEKGELKNDNEKTEPICIYMRKELVGEEILRNTTLRNLGLTGGRAAIRFLYRQPNTLKEQAHVCVDLPRQNPVVETNNEQNEPTNNLHRSTLFSNQNSSSNSNKVSKIFPMLGQIQEGSNTDHVTAEEKSDVMMTEGQIDQVQTDNVIEDSPMTEVDVPVENAINIGERNAVLFRLDDDVSSIPDLPDEFYEVTLDDVKYMYRDLEKQRKELEEKPLETAAIRDRRQQMQLLSYQFSIIRINFPDRYVLQGIFLPTETIGDVLKFVQKFLHADNTDFYLYLTPPKRILSSDLVLYEEKLVPTAVLHFGSNNNSTNYLQEWCREKVSTPNAARYAAQLTRLKTQNLESRLIEA